MTMVTEDKSKSENLHIIEVDSDDASFVKNYLQHRRDELDNLRAALNQGDFNTIKQVAHKMKGTGSLMGMPYISSLGKRIEEATIRKNHQEIEQLLQDLANYLAIVKIVER
jgi:HPt (histidine-containing phosphotransfer) domain-containing protein